MNPGSLGSSAEYGAGVPCDGSEDDPVASLWISVSSVFQFFANRYCRRIGVSNTAGGLAVNSQSLGSEG